jgi:hypothetical protein
VGNPYAPPEPGHRVPPRPATPPAPSPPPQRARPPADPAAARETARAVTRFAAFMLAAMLCLQLPVPWQAAGIAFTAGGLVTGVTAVRRAVAARLGAGLLGFLGVGLAVGVVMLLLQVAAIALWPAAFELQECRRDALTLRAQEQCQRGYERWIEERTRLPSLDRPTGS